MEPVAAIRRPTRGDETKSLMQSFSNIAEKWGLSTDEQLTVLGQPARSTYFKWKKDGGLLPTDTEERISYVLAIYKALHILFPQDTAANEWLRKPNVGPSFGGKSALEVIFERGLVGLYRVRSVLDAQRGGWA